MANIGKSLDRRRFLKYFAMGAAAAPLVGASRSVLARREAAATPSLCYGNKRVLTASDISWLGVFKVPLELCVGGTDPSGTLAARYVSGQLRFFMQGADRDGSPIFEFGNPGVGQNQATAPRASVIRAWGVPYDGRKKAIDNTLLPTPLDTQLYWDDVTQALYWLYCDPYNVTGQNNPVVGCTRLNDQSGTFQSEGPWQLALGPHQTHRVMLRIPEEFAATYLNGRSLALGCIGTSSGNISASWGPVLASLNSNIGPGVPAYPATPQIGVTKLVGYDFTNRARRTDDYVVHFSPDLPGGYWTQMDGYTGTGCWVETANCTGMVFFQMRATGHVWYGTSENCGHGLSDTALPGTTGPHCTSSRMMAYVYDPQDFVRVIKGNAPSYGISANEIDMTAKGLWAGQYQRSNGSFFDATTGRLYVTCRGMDQVGTPVYPIVNVYQVA